MGWTNAMLIEQYSQHPCLFSVKNKHYHNKHLRSLALNQITESLKPLIPAITEADVQKKFLGLRTTYSNERKKVLTTLHSGTGEEEVYKPSLWYYDNMAFLNESLEIRTHRSSFQPSSKCSKISMETEEQCEDSEQEALNLDGSADYELTEGEYELQNDGSLLAVGEASPRLCDTSNKSRPTSRQSVISDVPAKKKKSDRLYSDKKNTNLDQDMIMLGEVTKNLGKISEAVQGGSCKKTAEDIFGEFVATQLKKITDEDEKNEVQFSIHGLLRNALRNNNVISFICFISLLIFKLWNTLL